MGGKLKRKSPSSEAQGAVSDPGTRPQGIQDEREASRYVREMFSGIARKYDVLNRLLSLSLDKVWRRRTARQFRSILQDANARVLDLCCGTGDLALELWNVANVSSDESGEGFGARIFGTDFAHPMLERAAQKSKDTWKELIRAVKVKGEFPGMTGHIVRRRQGISYAEGDALQLPFPKETFDMVTAAFGFRNLANYEAGLKEIHRVLKPGGQVGILEFAAPKVWPIAPLYRFYFTTIVPRIGGRVSGSRSAYDYLPNSVERFPVGGELSSKMGMAGFCDCAFVRWTGGIVALHTAKRR